MGVTLPYIISDVCVCTVRMILFTDKALSGSRLLYKLNVLLRNRKQCAACFQFKIYFTRLHKI